MAADKPFDDGRHARTGDVQLVMFGVEPVGDRFGFGKLVELAIKVEPDRKRLQPPRGLFAGQRGNRGRVDPTT